MHCQEADAERPWAARVPSPFPDDGSVLGVSLPVPAKLPFRSAYSMTAKATSTPLYKPAWSVLLHSQCSC